MVNLVLSLDYEIFGNGSGDVQRDMIEPTQRLLALCDKYDAKVSVMFEVGEYWAMKKAEGAGLLHLDYSPSQEIEKQVRYAAKYGHDVQLHLHPWWIAAKLVDGRWQLHPERRQIIDLPHGLGSDGDHKSIVGVLSKGKRTLETMIRPVCPEYECLIYRAAMFWGQPSTKLIRGMKMAGLSADSSVISGLYETAPVPTDYRKAKSAIGYWWTSAEDISQSGPTGEYILEFPVYSRLRPYLYNLKWTKLCATLKRRDMEKNDTHGYGMKDTRQSTEPLGIVFKRLYSSQPLKYDFCKLSAKDMIKGLKLAIREDQLREDDLGTPVVMLGHSKDFWNDRNFERFLHFIKKECREKVCFSNFADLTKKILQKDTRYEKESMKKILS